jgi:hypothetical protein
LPLFLFVQLSDVIGDTGANRLAENEFPPVSREMGTYIGPTRRHWSLRTDSVLTGLAQYRRVRL